MAVHKMWSKSSLIGRLRDFSKSTFAVLGISTFLFMGLNAGAYYLMPYIASQPPANVFDAVLWPHSEMGKRVLPEIFGVKEWEEAIKYNDVSPSFAMHPSLSFITEPVRNEHFSMSVEGVRLEPSWSGDSIRRQLGNHPHLIFALGGSTMLGHGVGGNHTIPFYMNEALQKSDNLVLNFGSQAYDQLRAIEKLVYLLRSGFQPQCVIFLDGWNDIIGMARSNQRPQDKLVYHGFVTNRGHIAFTPGDRRDDRKHVKLFLESLPVYRLFGEYQSRSFQVEDIVVERDAFVQGFDFYEAEFVHSHWFQFADQYRDLLKTQIVESFVDNLKFLKDLSKGFNFQVYSFFQPIGLLDLTNPFVPETARKAAGYDYILDMEQTLSQAIDSGTLEMIDLSEGLREVLGQKYVDVAHYSPLANKMLATEIIAKMGSCSHN